MVTNLQRYAIGDGNKLFDVGCAEVIGTPTGMWCKFEEAVEASSNSLQQLKAEICHCVPVYPKIAVEGLIKIGFPFCPRCGGKLSAV